MSSARHNQGVIQIAGKTGQALIDEVNATEVAKGQCAFWWLGQHSFIVKLGEFVIYIDPYLSPSESRNVPALLRPEQITNADAIIGTHDHGDHIDRPIWPALAAASPEASFYVPRPCRASIVNDLGIAAERVHGLEEDCHSWLTLSHGGARLHIHAIPAAHELLSVDPATGCHECVGVILEGNGITLYHAGDTCIYEGIQDRLRQWKLDLAFLPINGRDGRRLKSGCIGNMTFQEAVDLAGAVRPGLTVPTHWDMFDGNTENPELFMEYISVKYPDLRARIPVHGERVIVGAAE